MVRHLKAVENRESSQAGTAGNACVLTFDKISACRTPCAVMLDVYRMPPTAPSSLFTLPLYWWRFAEPAVTSCLRCGTSVSRSPSRMHILNSTGHVDSSICIWLGLCAEGSLHCKHSTLDQQAVTVEHSHPWFAQIGPGTCRQELRLLRRT